MISCQNCKQPATIHITEVLEPRSRTAEFHLCEQHARERLDAREQVGEGSEACPQWAAHQPERKLERAICFDINRIIISELGDQQVVYLREVGGERCFPIVIGIFEARALDMNLKGIQATRPLTHNAWANTIAALGGDIEDVLLRELREYTYYATIRIRQAGQLVEIDTRPSDAFVIAIICDVPIFVAETLADEVGA